jgi:hypothetical protein
VALKVLRAGGDAEPHELARFKVEAEAVARLHHPNIVQIHEIAEHDGRPCLCLELVDGGGLDARLQGQPLPPEPAAELVATLAEAMHAAHQRGIVHRDLKPANILLTADGTPKITDFGLAKRLDRGSQHTQSGSILGTPQYMAPEQAGGSPKDISPAVDVYALGAILYELLTGRPPFKGEHLLDTLDQVRWQAPVPPRRLQPGVPRDLEAICLKCLEKERTRRYGTAAALAEDLGRFLRGERTEARWGRVARARGLAGWTGAVLETLAAVPGTAARRWRLTLLCFCLSVVLAGVSSQALAEWYSQKLWRISGSLMYTPEAPAQVRGGYTPPDFATVLNLIKAHRNFDQLVEETSFLRRSDPNQMATPIRLDTNLLARAIFKISPLDGGGGEGRNIGVSIEWKDPKEGVQLVERFMEISRQQLRENRRSIIDEQVGKQQAILDRLQTDVDKARKELERYLQEKGVRDAAVLQLDCEIGTKLAREAESAVATDTRTVEGIRIRVAKTREKLAQLKAAKGQVESVDQLAFKERLEAVQARINEEEGNLVKAKAVLTRAEEVYKIKKSLLRDGAISESGMKDAEHQHDLAREEVRRRTELIERLKQAKAQAKPGPGALQALQGNLDVLEIDLSSSESILEQSQRELAIRNKRAAEVAEALREALARAGALAKAEKEREGQRFVLRRLRDYRDVPFFELRIVDPAKASLYSVSSNHNKIGLIAFFVWMVVLLPGVVIYDRLRGQSGRRRYPAQVA